MIKKYIKKPIPVEAVQYTGENYNEIKSFVGESLDYTIYLAYNNKRSDYIRTAEGNLHFHKGDYIIKGIKGEFYPCRQDIFEETYQEVKD